MGEGEPLADLLHHGELLGGAQLVLGDGVLEVHPLEQLHRHEDLLAFEAELVDRDDVGVVELGDRFRLAPEALLERLVGVEARPRSA